MKKIAILQSNYIPWKGYFDLINMVDVFVLYDDAQYTRRDWRNRNKIKSPQGLKWLSIPIESKGKYFQKINETKVSNESWAEKHWQSIKLCYSRSKYFDAYKDFFESIYFNCNEKSLSEINYKYIAAICELMDIKTKIKWSSDYELVEGKTERLLDICEQEKASIYISGPAAKDYLNLSLAAQMEINIEWMDYSDYPEYSQLYSPFKHDVTILDLIFNEGPNAKKFMKSYRNEY